MESSPGGKVTVTTTTSSSPPKAKGGSVNNNSPKGGEYMKYCLCSPTKHEGSFRCKFHRSFKRSNSMPPPRNVSALSPKSIDDSA